MEIEIRNAHGLVVALIKSEEIVINDLSDSLDLIGNCDYQGATNIILKKEHFTSEFFDLKTKLAGDVLQKISTYNMRLAIIGDFTNIKSKSLSDFIFESNKIGRVLFVKSVDDVYKKWTR